LSQILLRIARLRTDGVVSLTNAIDPASLRMAEEAYNWSLAHPGPGSSRFSQPDSSATFYQDLANPNAISAYRRMLEESPAADLAAALWGTHNVWFMYEQVFLKEGGQSRRTPWHQDSSYLPIGGDMLAVMWITFEAVAKEYSLEFVRGSHRGTLFDGSRFDEQDDTAPLYGDGSLPRLPNIKKRNARDGTLFRGPSNPATCSFFILGCCTAVHQPALAVDGAHCRCVSLATMRFTLRGPKAYSTKFAPIAAEPRTNPDRCF
jgi:Phytanoyl-CoA dioxygenase (PhyH)